MSNQRKNGHRPRSAAEVRSHQIGQGVEPRVAAADLSATTTVAIATGVKVGMARPPQFDGRPCILLTFVNGEQEFTPPMLLVDGLEEFGAIYANCLADVAKIVGELSSAEATAPPAEGAIVTCDDCGTRLFGDRISVGKCAACEVEAAKAQHPSGEQKPQLRVLNGGAGE